jgi:cytochrome c biogenesis protein
VTTGPDDTAPDDAAAPSRTDTPSTEPEIADDATPSPARDTREDRSGRADEDPTNLSTKAGQGREAAPASAAVTQLSVVGWLRWAWRQLTSMRVAIMLLLLLAVASLPGAFIPQTTSDPAAVAQFRTNHPELSEWFERFDLFDMFTSVWFQTVYVLLFVSLIGCIVPRIGVHVRSLRAAPPKVPRRLTRFVGHSVREVEDSTPVEVAEKVRAALRRRFRTVVREGDGGSVDVSAERGYLRETGNILFHLALLGILVSFGLGQMLSYRGQAVIVQGDSFANSVVDYDSFDSGTLVGTGSLTPFVLTLDDFSSQFTVDAQARDFQADVTVTEPDGTTIGGSIRVNDPLGVHGTNIYLSGNGYAPRLTVTDGEGAVAFSQPVPFLPEDGVYTSRGVVKVPDVSPGQEQLGLTGTLFPTAAMTDAGVPISIHPQPNDPLLVLTVWAGDLGLDDGVPQNVYVLDTDGMEQVYEPADDGSAGSAEGGQVPLTLYMTPGHGHVRGHAPLRRAGPPVRPDAPVPARRLDRCHGGPVRLAVPAPPSALGAPDRDRGGDAARDRGPRTRRRPGDGRRGGPPPRGAGTGRGGVRRRPGRQGLGRPRSARAERDDHDRGLTVPAARDRRAAQ